MDCVMHGQVNYENYELYHYMRMYLLVPIGTLLKLKMCFHAITKYKPMRCYKSDILKYCLYKNDLKMFSVQWFNYCDRNLFESSLGLKVDY